MPEKQKSTAHVEEQRGVHRLVRRASPLSFRSATHARLANRPRRQAPSLAPAPGQAPTRTGRGQQLRLPVAGRLSADALAMDAAQENSTPCGSRA